MKRILMLLLIASSFGCRKIDKFQKILTDTSKNTYWVRMIDMTGQYQDMFDRFEFYSNGRLRVYHILPDSDKSYPFEGVEGELPNFWRYNNDDSTLKSNYFSDYKMVKYSHDTIHFNIKGSKYKFLFIRSQKRAYN